MKLILKTLIFIYSSLSLILANSIISTVNDKELLIGLAFRVSSYEHPAFMRSRRGVGGNITRSGGMVELVETLADYFQMRLVYVSVPSSELAKKGTGMSLIHQLQNDQVDFAPFVFMNILEYFNVIDLSYPMFVDDWILMQPFPNGTSRLNDPIKPFTSTVWLLFIASSAIFIMAMTVIIYTRKNNPSEQDRYSTLWEQSYYGLEYFLTIITSQGNSTPREMKRFLYRLMVALWLLSMVVLINVYTGIYTANMAVPKLEPTVDTLEDLAASTKFRMTIEMNTDMGYKALEAKSGPFKVFGDTLRQYPELLFTQALGAISNVIQENCVYPGSRNLINYYISADLKSYQKCRLTIATKPLPYYLSLSCGLQKDSPYTQIFNQKFWLPIWENGMLNYMREKHLPPVPARCLVTGRKPGRPTPLKLDDFAGAFVLLLFGLGFGKLVFIAELITARFNQLRK